MVLMMKGKVELGDIGMSFETVGDHTTNPFKDSPTVRNPLEELNRELQRIVDELCKAKFQNSRREYLKSLMKKRDKLQKEIDGFTLKNSNDG